MNTTPPERLLDENDENFVESIRRIAAKTPKPTAQQRILGALAVAIEGDAAAAQATVWLTWPLVVRPREATLRGLASRVLLAAARATLRQLPPDDLAPISQAIEEALKSWPPRFERQGDSNHFRPI